MSPLRRNIAFYATLALAAITLCCDTRWVTPMLAIQKGSSKQNKMRSFEEVRESLPEVQIVGFMSEAPEGSVGDQFYLAQYTVAPVIVQPNLDHKYIIASFNSTPEIRAAVAKNEFELFLLFDHGVALLKNPRFKGK